MKPHYLLKCVDNLSFVDRSPREPILLSSLALAREIASADCLPGALFFTTKARERRTGAVSKSSSTSHPQIVAADAPTGKSDNFTRGC